MDKPRFSIKDVIVFYGLAFCAGYFFCRFLMGVL
jgi:hypothetical protein